MSLQADLSTMGPAQWMTKNPKTSLSEILNPRDKEKTLKATKDRLLTKCQDQTDKGLLKNNIVF